MKIKKGDNVIVLTGADKGKHGKVLHVYAVTNKVAVEGVNKKKKHQKPRRGGEKGTVIDIHHPIHASNVALLDGGKQTRVGFKNIGNKKVRVSRKSGKEI